MSASAVPTAASAAAAEAAKTLLRIDGTGEDTLLAQLAATAIALGEAFLGDVMIARGFVDSLAVGNGCGDWRALAATPVSAIGALTAMAANGSATPVGVDDHAIDIDADGRGWVRLIAPVAATRLTVAYVAGLAETWDALPEAVAQGVVALTAHLFEDRDGASAPPAAVSALWRPFRRLRLVAPEHRS